MVVSTYKKVIGLHVKITKIGLVRIQSKLLVGIIFRGLSAAHEMCVCENEADIRTDWGRIDKVFNLRPILEHKNIFRRPTICLDLKAVFNPVDRAFS